MPRIVAISLTLLFFLAGGVFSHAVSISHPASDSLVRAETLIKLSHPSGAVGNSGSYYYGYDYRSRRVVRDERYASGRFKSVLTFSSGLSVTETLMNEIHDFYEDPDQDGRTNFYEYTFGGDPLSGWTASNYTPPFPVSGYHEWAIASISARVSAQTIINHRENSVVLKEETIRGCDMGGGVGGVLYSLRGGQRQFNSYNSRGDVVNASNDSGNSIWQAQYEALGTRTAERGSNSARQRANTKDEDPTGLLNEGFRYRDLETGLFITRDPLGFVDGPNVYTYVRQNPWSGFDPDGLFEDPVERAYPKMIVDPGYEGTGEVSFRREPQSGHVSYSGDRTSVGNSQGVLTETQVKWAELVASGGSESNVRDFVKHSTAQYESQSAPLSGMKSWDSELTNTDYVNYTGAIHISTVGSTKGLTPNKPQLRSNGVKSFRMGGGNVSAGKSPSGQTAKSNRSLFVPDEYWTRNAPSNVTPGIRRLDHIKYNETTKKYEQSRVTYDKYGRQNYRVDKTDHGRPSGNGHRNDKGHTNPHLHESTYAPQGTRGHASVPPKDGEPSMKDTGRKETRFNLK